MSEIAPVVWSPDRSAKLPSYFAKAGRPPLLVSLWRGLCGACPVCGKGRIFKGFLRVAEDCTECHAPLGRVRADDVPPYFTIMVVGHAIVPMMLWLERAQTPEIWVHSIIWVPLTVAMSLALIRPIKGATVGLMLHHGMVTGQDRLEGDA